jgi:hypothetical protein
MERKNPGDSMRSAEFNVAKRHTIRTLAGVGLAGLSGCCSLRGFPEPTVRDVFDPNGVPFVLRPAVIQRSSAKSTKYCIDAHAHFFNATDVNVRGYIEECIAHGLDDEQVARFVRALGPVADLLAGVAPTAGEEYHFLEPWSRQIGALTAGAQTDVVRSEYRRRVELASQALSDELKRRGLDREFFRLRSRAGVPGRAALPGEARQDLSPEFLRELMQDWKGSGSRAFAATAAPADCIGSTLDPAGVLVFVLQMLMPRWVNVWTYAQAFSTDESAFGVDAVFGALVDFDYWLDCAPLSSREDQMKVQALISQMTGGYMLPLVAYNPWTDIERRDASFDLVKTAISKYGYIGVKIYPAVGYYPYGNADNLIPTKPRPDLGLLDDALLRLFKWCAKHEVPVMAHANQTMGRNDASDDFGGPVGWKALFDRFGKDNAAGRSTLTPVINAGHFGGDAPKCVDHQPVPGDWPVRFAELMRKPEGARFFGDLGYWTGLRNCSDGKDIACAIARDRLKAAVAVNPDVTRRIMYGSDWLMLAKEPQWGAYPAELAQALAAVLPPDRLFYLNAIDCFGLGANGAHRDRIVQRLGKDSLPPWLEDAASAGKPLDSL